MKAFRAATMILALVGAETASAQTFTTKATAKVDTSVLVPHSSGMPQGAYFMTGTWMIDWSAGKTATYASQCTESIAPPGMPVWNGFGACVLTDKANGDVITITASCTLSKPTEGNCFGYLKSDTGTFKGRSGTISWHDTLHSNDLVVGSVITQTGAGQWYE